MRTWGGKGKGENTIGTITWGRFRGRREEGERETRGTVERREKRGERERFLFFC